MEIINNILTKLKLIRISRAMKRQRELTEVQGIRDKARERYGL